MRSIISVVLLIFVLTGFTSVESVSSFCECFKKGYIKGYCMDQNPNVPCTKPNYTPTCPYPRYGADKCEDGYSLGIIKGAKDYARR